MKKTAIEIKNLSYTFGDYLALDKVNFVIHQGDITAIIGPNGSGKTTLLKNIIGLYTPTTGSVKIFGQKPKFIRTKIGYVPQKFEFRSKK
jgi:zinc transport system ATP-binding protein